MSFCLQLCLFLLVMRFLLVWSVVVVGGLYEEATFWRSARSWPLSTNRLVMKVISFWRCASVEQIRWARQSSDLKEAIAVLGCWQELGLIVILVLDGFL